MSSLNLGYSYNRCLHKINSLFKVAILRFYINPDRSLYINSKIEFKNFVLRLYFPACVWLSLHSIQCHANKKQKHYKAGYTHLHSMSDVGTNVLPNGVEKPEG